MKITAILERAKGNGECGTSWVETATFDSMARLRDVIGWAANRTGDTGPRGNSEPTRQGRLMLDITDENGH